MNPQRRAWLLALAGTATGLTQPAQALTRRALHFPRDHGSHPETRTEWWYLTGWLHAADERETDPAAPGLQLATVAPIAGFQLTFFRSRTGFGEGHPSAFAARQLLFAHAAVTDLSDRTSSPPGRLLHDQRSARAGLGLAGASTEDTALVMDAGPRAWTLRRRSLDGQSLYEAGWQNADVALQLTARATQPLLLQGDAGWSRKGPQAQQASQYVSEPQLAVAGRLQRGGRSFAVRGRAWLDHEWSDELLAEGLVGWDWIGMNLFDGSALTAFQLRDAAGQAQWRGGSWRRAGSVAQPFEPAQVRFEPLGPGWQSPTTGARYPMAWQVHTPAGRWTVRPVLAEQELDSRASTGTAYWEGLCDLLDPQDRVVGRGYLEMTGYAGALKLTG